MIQNTLITSASFTPNSLRAPNAWVGHLPFAAWVIQEISPKIFVELGTHSGNSYFTFCQSVAESGGSTKCYAVDTWQGDEHAGEYNEDIFTKVNAHNQESYAEFSRLLRMTFDDAATYFSDGSIDLLHIDGLHTYEAVLHDFETWLPKLAPGAVVMFHDTNVRERSFGVWKLWEELQARYQNNLEFVHSHGLGVVQLNNAVEDKKLEWLQPGSSGKQRLINYFAALGARQLERFELNLIKQHASSLNEIVVERDGQIAALTQTLVERDGQISNLSQTVAERDRQITALYNSTSWRATQLLRIAGYQAKRIHYAINLLAPAVKHGGGLKNTLNKAYQLYRREGFPGIKSGFRIVDRSIQLMPSARSAEFDRNNYTEWVRRYDTLTDKIRVSMKESIGGFVAKPLISVLMPTYNPKSEWLSEAIESVRNQLYPNWELCIADDASTDPAVRQILQEYIKKDSRIKVVFRKENGHISAASNSALDLATGQWIALLDHDDLLTEHALFWVVDAIVNNPNADLIYSDEDKIDQSGRRFDPYFKSDWNPDLFLSHNMICHLGVYRTSLVKKLMGFREGLEGAQDYDLALRCIEQLKTGQILHIPRVLYH